MKAIRYLMIMTTLSLGVSLTFAVLPGAEDQNQGLKVGDRIESFQALDDQGKNWRSADALRRNQYLVVYFYPAAMTGGCTKQACAFRDHKDELKDLKAEVIGVSGDSVQNLQYFKKAHQLNFTLLADPDGAITKKFGVPLRDGGSITRTVDGQEVTLTRGVTTARWTFILDRKGKIVYKNSQVNAEMDSQEVIAFLQNPK